MRRQDRRVTDIEEIKSILNSTRIIHLGMMMVITLMQCPYILVLNLLITRFYIYVHGHHEGKKFDLIKANPHVFIEIDGSDRSPLFQVVIFLVHIVQFIPV